MLLSLVPWPYRLLAIGAALLAAAAFGAWKMHEHDEARYEALQAKFDTFQDKVRIAGLDAQAKAKAQAEADQKRKTNADKENSDALATLAAAVARVRADAGRHPVPATPTCSSDPQGSARYRDEFAGAYRELAAGLREEAQRCDINRIGLNTGKGWAAAPRQPR